MLRSLAFLLIVAAALYYGYSHKESFLAHALSKRLCCDISIQSAKLTPTKLTLQGVNIRNPYGSLSPYALEGATIKIEASPFDLFKSSIPIRHFTITDATMQLEFKEAITADNNWAKLLRQLSQKQDGKGFTINHLTISNIHFKGLPLPSKKNSLPTLTHLELEHLGTPTPLALGPLSRIIFQSILSTLTTKPQFNKLLDHVATSPIIQEEEQHPPSSLPTETTQMLHCYKLYL